MLKFSVKGLGRVNDADIALAPLTILVGKNNTGKSYLATLIWALSRPGLLTEVGAFRRKPSWFANFVGPIEATEVRSIVLDADTINSVLGLTERAFNRKSAELLSNVFAVKGFENTKVKFTAKEEQPYEFSLELYYPNFSSATEEEPRVGFYATVSGEKRIVYSLQNSWLENDQQWLSDLIFQEIIGYCLFGAQWRAYRNNTYIPAARTGIMLALPSLVSQSLGSTRQADATGLPKPLSSFLSRMTERSVSIRARSTPVRDRLQERLLRGQISAPKESVSDFRYTPEGMEVALPLHATSSMITELAPFMVALQNEAGTHHFIFEEPEAHLHLEAQREMARIIARLVAAGTPVTLTTHSDTFLQQINNLMVLAEHPNRDQLKMELGYEDNDLIPADKVEAYEFCPSEAGTIVNRIEKSNDGFIVETLNETLLALAKETLFLRSGRNG